MMEKNGRIEIGKTPAEDVSGKPARHIVMGNPVHNEDGEEHENSFEKISFMLHTGEKIKKGDKQRKVLPGEEGPAS